MLYMYVEHVFFIAYHACLTPPVLVHNQMWLPSKRNLFIRPISLTLLPLRSDPKLTCLKIFWSLDWKTDKKSWHGPFLECPWSNTESMCIFMTDFQMKGHQKQWTFTHHMYRTCKLQITLVISEINSRDTEVIWNWI